MVSFIYWLELFNLDQKIAQLHSVYLLSVNQVILKQAPIEKLRKYLSSKLPCLVLNNKKLLLVHYSLRLNCSEYLDYYLLLLSIERWMSSRQMDQIFEKSSQVQHPQLQWNYYYLMRMMELSHYHHGDCDDGCDDGGGGDADIVIYELTEQVCNSWYSSCYYFLLHHLCFQHSPRL